MIKKYLQFIKEDINGFDTLGEWIESLIDDDYIKNIVSRFTKDSDISINLSNAINILDDNEKDDIKHQIEDYLRNGIQDKTPSIIASTDLEDINESVDLTISGKGVFSSFLKSLTALGKKDTKEDWEKCPEDFLFYYSYVDINSDDVKQVFSRFKSLKYYMDNIDYQHNDCTLYFGIRTTTELEYGIKYDDELKPFGRFKLNNSAIKWLRNLESKSAFSIKKELVNLNFKDLLILGKIKNDMKDFNPGYHEKRLIPMIKDGIIIFGYYGLGNWNNGIIDSKELESLKNNFNTWILSKKWGNLVLSNIKTKSFWIYLSLKLK
jgi:hypothetical protein